MCICSDLSFTEFKAKYLMSDKSVSDLANKHKDAPAYQPGTGRRLHQTYLEWDWRTKGVVRAGAGGRREKRP